MRVLVLLQDGNSDVLSETLSELEWKSCIEPHSLTHSITWKRSVPQVANLLFAHSQCFSYS